MRYSETERRALIDKLKNIRDPRERDRIIWALAGQERASHRDIASTAVQPRPANGRSLLKKPPSDKPPEPQTIPQMAADIKKLVGFLVPGFLFIIGCANLLQALLRFVASGKIEPEIPHLITGGIFLIVGMLGILKTMQSGRGKGMPGWKNAADRKGFPSQ